MISLSNSVLKLQSYAISISPTNSVNLKPKEILPVELIFEPKHRIPPFSEELWADIEGSIQPLLAINGSGHGIEFKLETDIITFGSVVEHGSSVQKVKLKNIGDIGTKFKWDLEKFGPHFSRRYRDCIRL